MAALKHALRQRGLVPDGAVWTPLSGGRTNRLWRITGITLGQVVLKLFSRPDDNPLFPNLADDEARLLRHLDGRHLAPKLLARFDSDLGPCLLYPHVSGRTWHREPSRAADLLHRVHRVPPPPGLRKVPDGSAAIAAQTRAILNLCPDTDDSRDMPDLTGLRPVPPQGARCLLHGDPVPGNLVGSGPRWRLIDWQCPAVGDPCEDLAMFLSPAMQLLYRGHPLCREEAGQFLSAYPGRATVLRYRALAPWYHQRMVAYCRWLHARGHADAMRAMASERDALASSLRDRGGSARRVLT